MPTILIADDEKNIRATLARSLHLEGYATQEAGDGAQALGRLESGDIDLMILDLQMPVLDGLALLETMSKRGIGVPVLVLTAHGTIDKAVRAIRTGAFDFIEKPPAVERILLAVANALRYDRLEKENRQLAEEVGRAGQILGSSASIEAVIEMIRKVAPAEAGVLLLGENGTGKELVAHALHDASRRRGHPLITVNCAAIPETLCESELFGHVRGAFTGAVTARRGKFQQADGGTLFLDELGEVPLSLQPKLLRALDSGEIERVGAQTPEQVNVRVIAATNRNLDAEVSAGRFREDLFYRLLVVPIRVPPLRERREDIPLLARHFLDAACRRNRIRPKRLSDRSIDALQRHSWPGNVRELRNAIERIAILVPDETVDEDQFDFLEGQVATVAGPAALGGGAGPTTRAPAGASGTSGSTLQAPSGAFDLASEVTLHEREIIVQVLERNRWRMSRAARELNLERSHLYKKLRAHGIERPNDD